MGNNIITLENWNKYLAEKEAKQKEYTERQAKIAAEHADNQKVYDDLLNFDVDAGQEEINNLEAILKKANELSFSPTAPTESPTTVTRNGISYSVDSKGNYSITPNNAGNTRVEAGYALRDSAEKAKTAQYEYLNENGYSSIQDLEKAIKEKKEYLSSAQSTQSTHAALSKYNKTQEENADEINSLYTDMGTKKSSYEENGKGALDWISKGIAAFMYGDSPKNIAVSNEESEYMSASEKYYTAKYGTKAEQQELLNIFKQSGDSKYSQEIKELTHSLYGDSAFDEYIVGNVEAGARNFFYETAATFNAITSIFGLPIDETKAYQDLKKAAKAQNVYASNAAIALGDTDNIGGNLIQVAMAFIPDLILTVATKGSSGGGATTKSLIKIARAGIKAQKTASITNKVFKYGSGMLDAVSKGISATAKNPMFWTSFSHTFGTDYETALEGGADTTTAYLYATITSITNALVEVGSGVESRLPDVISGKSKFQILDFIKECLEEGNEEVIQGVITNLNQLLYDSDKEFFSLENEDAIINPSRMLKEHAMGTLGGAVLGGGTKIGQRIIGGSTRGITLAGKSAIRNNIVSDLAEFGRTAADENVRAVSEGFLTTGKITNYDAGVLFTHAQKQINYDLNLAKTPAKTRAAIQKYIKGNYPEAIKQMVIGNEIAKMYDISDIASKVNQREYSFSTNENNGGIINSTRQNSNNNGNAVPLVNNTSQLSFSPEQKEASILKYKSSESYMINAKLREDIDLTDEEQVFVNTLDEALSELPIYEGTVYRQIIFDDFGEDSFNQFLQEHTPGQIVFYPSFTSCSTTEDGYTVEGNYKVQLIVEGKNARNVDGYGNNMEKEVIFPRNSAFIVKNINTNGQHPIIYLQEDFEDGYNTTQKHSNAVQHLQAPHTVYGNLQSVSEENTDGNTIRQVRPQSSPSAGQRDKVRTGRRQETLLPPETNKQVKDFSFSVPKSIYTEPDLTAQKPQSFEKLAAREIFGDREHSIDIDENGEYVKIDTQQEIFNGKTTQEMQDIAKKIIQAKFKNKVLDVGENDKAYVNKRSSDEYAYPANRRMDNTIKEAKMKAAPELDNLLSVSQFIEHQNDDGRHPKATGGWNVYLTRLKIGEEMFSGEVKIMITDRGYLFYDITKIKRLPVNSGQTETNSAAASGNLIEGNNIPSNSIIRDSAGKINKNFKNANTPMFTEPDLTAQTPQTFEESAMANIIGGDAQLTDGQRRVNSIARLLKMEPVWDVVGDPEVVGKGYYENGVIHLNKQAPALATVYLHEFCHRLQRSGNWNAFVSFSRSTPVYKQWICEKGGSNDFATAEANYKAQIKKAYESKTGSAYNDTRLTNEIMARFISEKMMLEYASGQNTDLATATEHFLTEIAKHRKWYHIVMDWINEMINRLARRHEQADFLKFQRMLKQAYNDVQSKAAQVDTGREYDINQNFYSEFDSWDGKDTNKVFTIGTTSGALKSVNIKNQEIKMRSGMILQKLSKHPEMSRQIFRDIPELLENPIIIQFSDAIDPNTGKPKYDSRITVMGELYADMVIDGKTVKKPVLVSLELLPTNQKKTQILNISFVTSAYTKDTLQQYINENSILYIDPNKKRTQNWLSLNRLSLPLGENQTGPIRKITYIGEKVKIENSTKKTDIQLALEKAGVIDSYGNSIFKNSHNDTSKSKENFENREYSFDESDVGERVPAKLYAKELLQYTGSSYEAELLAKDIEKIYAAADKGDARSVTSLSQDTAAKILNDIEKRDFSKEGENAGENALHSLTNEIINHINEETHGTLNPVRAENKRLTDKVNNFEAAQQRKTDNANSIKEQLRANSNLLNSMDVIEHFDSNENFKSNAETLEWVQQQFSKIDYKVYRDDFGEIILDKKRIKNGLSYLKTNEERLAFALVPKVLQEGIEISQHFEHKGRAYDTVTFAAPVKLNGQRGNMAVVVRKEGKNYYKVHRLLLPNGNSFVINEKRDIAETAGGVNKNSSLSPTDNVSINIITNSYENVNTTDSNGDFDLKQIRSEERKKFEAAQQRKTDLDVIKRAVNRIDTKLRQNSNAKHVPKELRKAAIEFCSIFAQNDTSVFDSTKIWNVRKLYDALLNSQKANGYGNADPDILEDIQYIGDVMQNRRLISLNKTERETVRRIAEHLEHLINTTNEIFIEEKKQEAAKVAEEEIERLSKKSSKAYINLGDGALRRSVDKVKEFLHVGNKPSVFFFEEVGGLLEKVYKDISNGFDKAIFNLQECSEQLQGIIQNHDYKKWLKDKKAKQKATRGGLVLKKQDGQQMTVTPEQVMSIYAINLREEANQDTKGTNHLKQGGIVLATREIIQQIKGDTKQNKKETAENTLDKMIKHGWFTAWADKPYRIDDNDIKQIKEYLGKDGMAFVEEMVHWLSTVGAQLGNEASMKLYNINKFGEEYYFPIETSSDYIARQVFEKKGNKTLAGSSFAKNVTEKANTPIVVGNFLDICADHMIAMCAYNALTVPIDNFKRIWGYSAVGENGEAAVSLRNEIKRIFGQEYVDYIDRFIKDVDGGIDGQQPGDSLAAELIGKFKKNAVVAKLSVAIQQPSSLLRAMAYIEPKYLFSKGAKLTTAEWNECMKYNSVAIQKEIGRFDVGNPKTARDYMLGTEYNGAKEKIDGFLHDENYRDDVLGKGPEFMDKFTWCIIWNGCKAKARDNLKAAATKVNTALSDVKKRITQNMSDSERYEILKDKHIKVAEIDNSKVDQVLLENPELLDKELKRVNAEKILRKVGEEFEVFGQYQNPDIELNFEFGKNNLSESLNKQKGNFDIYAQMLSCFPEVINNAVGIEVHNRNSEGYKTDATLKNVYVLCSAFDNGTEIIPVKLEVKEFSDKPNRLYVAVSLEGIKNDRVESMGVPNNRSHIRTSPVNKNDRVAGMGVPNNRSHVRTSPVNISISEIFEKINPKDKDFIKYIPDEFFNPEKAKQVDFEEQVKLEAAKLFKEVIEHTQVYDSVLSRSQNMRSHSRWTQIVTSFMGEATVNLSLLLKAVSEFKNGNRKFAGKIVGSIVASTFLNALLKSLVTAMRDDEEDKSYGEKYVTAVGQNFWSDVWPHTWVPLISDAASIWEGYKIERADMSLVQDLYNGLNALDSDKKSTWDKILGIAAPLSSMTGVPVGNIARDIGSFVKTVSHALNDDLEHTHGFKYAFNEGMWGEKKFAEYYEIMRDKQKKGDTQGYTELKEYLTGRGKTEKEIESGVKAAYSKSKAVTNQADDYFARLAKNALFGNLDEEKQADVKTAVKRYLTESAMNAATGKEMSKTNQKAAEAQKNGSSAVNYFLAKASFEDTDNSGGISNEEKIAAINKMNISAFEKQALIMLYTKK